MILKRNIMVGRDIQLPPQPQSLVNITFLKAASFHRPWRRKNRIVIRSCNYQLSSSSYSSNHNLILSFLSQLDLLAPTLGFTTALAILYKSTTTTSTSVGSLSGEIGDWTLSTSPTPFNRFLKLRCASLLQLTKEYSDEHLMSFDTGPIIQQQIPTNDHHQLSYQRICINTDDGGVVSLDWPADLDLTKEHGLDTTILIFPGTTDGSMDENVRSFVYECFNRGCFPIVMNPRGCARSPLTTPRLFTAADSDDISSTVQFINRARPWTTLMAVGFGYGANMLTKYLAEVGEETPLTAATCLDNPFDLNRTSDHFIDQNLVNGFINMLQSNKELFQGRSKGFDVEKGLEAKSVKDFEEAISMVSYGFDSLEDFYISSSTRDVVGNIKIPLLFIQNKAVASISIPHNLIAENPFTSLLTCTFQSVDNSTIGTSWCQHLVIEWLSAVELAFLKGRHPLLEDIDVTLNPSKRSKLTASKNVMNLDLLNGNTPYPSNKILKRSDDAASSGIVDLQKSKVNDNEDIVTQTSLVDSEVDGETGKVLQATEVVMNLLDVKMPEALSPEQKQKVLTAVEQGETLMNALQGAVPEDVRGKLTSSVTAILEKQKQKQNEKKNLNGNGHVFDVPAALNTKIPEKEPNQEKEPNREKDPNQEKDPKREKDPNQEKDPNREKVPNQEKDTNQEKDPNQEKEPNQEKKSNQEKEPNQEKELNASELNKGDTSIKHDDTSEPEAQKNHEESGSENNNSKEKTGNFQDSDSNSNSSSEQVVKLEQKDAENSSDEKSISSPKSEESENQKKEETSAVEPNIQNNNSENQKKEESSAVVPNNNSPSFHVSEALDALTGMDDSTQVAVNSVFSVIEGMITQLEGNTDHQSAVDDTNTDTNTNTNTDTNTNTNTNTNTDTEKDDEKSNKTSEAIAKVPYRIQKDLFLKTKTDKLLNSDPAPALFLDYVPEEGKWKLIDQSEDATNSDLEGKTDIIEPAYVILDNEDNEGDRDPLREYKTIKKEVVKESIYNSLKVEVSRRTELDPVLKKELKDVAKSISLAAIRDDLQADYMLDAISSAVEETKYMKQVIPVGIVVGSTLASLKQNFNIHPHSDSDSDSDSDSIQAVRDRIVDSRNKVNDFYSEDDEYEDDDVSNSVRSDSVMVGAVTAALGVGASAFLVHQQDSDKEDQQQQQQQHEETSDQNVVTSLAEKAMSVAAPMVPTKEDGGVDQDRIVALLADLGQKGGILKLVGKLALLWGGIRGAMSLTGKLISFLRLSQRPLLQRILGFVSMVLVLWTPVVVPLLPTLVQNWADHNSSKFAELACIIGLYGSIMILIVLWGKRIRGYEDPLERYGLTLTSPTQLKNFAYGLIGGTMLVISIQSINILLGFVSISSPAISISTDAVSLLNLVGKVVKLVGQGLITTVSVSIVEEVLFRSWLTEEIATDLGYNQGIILSGLAFSLSQWSLKAVPGLWLLSLGLAGVRQRCHGNLSVPIGLRAGIMASSFALKQGGFLINQPVYPLWVFGGDIFQPFNSIVGLAVALLWAVILYPQKETLAEKNIKE